MTKEEAIEILEGLGVPIHAETAFDMAIEALKRQEGYCDTCKWSSDHTNEWYTGTRCPIEEHYALPKDGFCHLYKKVEGKVDKTICPVCGSKKDRGERMCEKCIRQWESETGVFAK